MTANGASATVPVDVVVAADGFVETRVLRIAAGSTVAQALHRAGVDVARFTAQRGTGALRGVSLFGAVTWASRGIAAHDRIDVVEPVSVDVRQRRQDRVRVQRDALGQARDERTRERRARGRERRGAV